jgi:hypothetical protein
MAKYFKLAGYEIELTQYGRYRVRAAYLREDEEPAPGFVVEDEICRGFYEATPENP